MSSLSLGAIEKWLLFEQLGNPSFFTNWLVALEEPIDPRLLAAALKGLRRMSPVHFSTIAVTDDGRRIEAELDAARDIEDFVVLREETGGGAHGLLRHLLTHPLNPFEEGLLRCHYVESPSPLVALQSSHVAGDGFTNGWLRATFIELCSRAHRGVEQPEIAHPGLGGYNLKLADVRQKVPVATIDFGGRVPPRTLRRPRMRARHALQGPALSPVEPRTFRALLDRASFGRIFARSQSFGVSTLAYTAACMALSVDRCFDEWASEPGDFFAVNIPRDFRFVPEWRGQLGNVVYPVGVPILKDGLIDLQHAATTVFHTLQAAKDSWLFYRLFSHQVRAAGKAVVKMGTDYPSGPPLAQEGDSVFIDPLPVLGVTELPARRTGAAIGPARIIEAFFQSPIIGRRSVEGGAVLAGNVHWHPLFDGRIREFLQIFLNTLVCGAADDAASVDWELI